MTNYAIDRKIGINSVVDFIKVELSLKESVDLKEHNTKKIQVHSGFFVGISANRIKAVEFADRFITEEYIILTKDFKTYSLYNAEFFNIMSILVKNKDSRDLTIYKATEEDQVYANKFLASILEYFHTKNRTELDKWLVRIESYDIEETDLFFISEEEILLNVNLSEMDARKKSSVIPLFKSEGTFTHPNYRGAQTPPASDIKPVAPVVYKKYNYTVKEPMFFKRTTTRPSKKIIDKIKEAVILMGNNPTTSKPEETIIEGIEQKGILNMYGEADDDVTYDYTGQFPM